MKICPVGVQ